MRLRPSEAEPRVRIALGGNGFADGGQLCLPSTSTVYGVLDPGVSPAMPRSA